MNCWQNYPWVISPVLYSLIGNLCWTAVTFPPAKPPAYLTWLLKLGRRVVSDITLSIRLFCGCLLWVAWQWGLNNRQQWFPVITIMGGKASLLCRKVLPLNTLGGMSKTADGWLPVTHFAWDTSTINGMILVLSTSTPYSVTEGGSQ